MVETLPRQLRSLCPFLGVSVGVPRALRFHGL
jgi:hypothetical protein